MTEVRQVDLFTRRARRVRAPEPSELQVHIALVQWLRCFAAPGVVYWHCPNGEARDKRDGAKLKAMGTRKGVADLTFLQPCRPLLFLELKRRGAKPSEAQLEFADEVRRAGAEYAVCDSLDKALKLLTERGILRPQGKTA